MTVYLLIILLLLLLIYKFDVKGASHYRSNWERFVLLVLILLVGLRYHIGSDTVVYEWNFETEYTPYLNEYFSDWRTLTQPLWMFVMSFCKTVFGTFVAVQFFHAIVFNLLAFRFIKKLTDKTFTALLLLFVTIWFAVSFETLRESISVAIFLNATFLLRKKKYFKYILLGFVAMGFHSFAFLMFLIAPLIVIVLNMKAMVVAFALTTILVPFINADTFNELLRSIQVLMGDTTIADKMDLYIGERQPDGFSILGVVRLYVLGYGLPLLAVALADRNDQFESKFVLLYLVMSVLSIKIPILYRMDNYLTLFYIVLLVKQLYSHKIKPSLHTVFNFLVIGLGIMSSWDIYRPEVGFEYRSNINYDCRYFPYKSVFQDPDPVREAIQYYH